MYFPWESNPQPFALLYHWATQEQNLMLSNLFFMVLVNSDNTVLNQVQGSHKGASSDF